MTKLLSDEEIGNLIDIAYKTVTVGDSNGDKLTKDEFRGYMLATINTQKRLYAESVIWGDGMRILGAASKNMNKFMKRYGLEHTVVGQDPEMDKKWDEAIKGEPNFPNLRHESEV